MSRDYKLFLDDISVAGEKLLRHTHGLDFDQFIDDDKTFDAVLRNLEVIGEAAKNVPQEVRERYPDVEWRRMAGLRDIIAHGYFDIDAHILWDIVQNHIPALLEHVRHILVMEGEDSP